MADAIFEVSGARRLVGEARCVSDKSLSHRALILAALAEGSALVEELNEGEDVARSRACVAALGVQVADTDHGLAVRGAANRLHPASRALDCGNSGTTMRLLAGLCAGQRFTSTLDGDASLRRRPMGRLARPLRALGARVEGPTNGERAPLVVTGGTLHDAEIHTEVASAQVKSALLLAAVAAGVAVRVTEDLPSRDHTERLLARWGLACRFGAGFAEVAPEGSLRLPERIRVGADPSAAALLAASTLIVDGGDVGCTEVLTNPTRTGFARVLERMGVQVLWENRRDEGLEEVGELRIARKGPLRATEVAADEIPGLVDEVVALAVVAAIAEGTTVFRGVDELRHKESDRVRSTLDLLHRFGVDAWAEGDALFVRGGELRIPSEIPRSEDHRIAMASCALAIGACHTHPGATLRVDASSASISDPRFVPLLRELLD